MKILNFLTAIGNQFLFAFVALKVYNWFSPEVGFDLPTLTYLNVLVLTWLIALFKNEGLTSLYIAETHTNTKPEKTDGDISASVKMTVVYLVMWGYFYVVHAIFF